MLTRRRFILYIAILLVSGAAFAAAYFRSRSRSAIAGEQTSRLTASDDVVLTPPPPVNMSDSAAAAADISRARSRQLGSGVGYPEEVEAARAEIKAGELLPARRLLEAALAQRPEAAPVVYDIYARCLIELGLFHQARMVSEKMIKRAPANVLGYVALSRAFEGLGMTERRAEPLLTAAKEAAPDDAAAHIYLATEFDKLRDLPHALEQAQAAVKARPSDAPPRELLAGIQFKLRRFDDARSALELVLKDHPNDAPAHRILGQIYDNPLTPGRDRAAAETHYIEALRIAGPDADTLWRLGQLYLDLGRAKPAAYLFLQVLKISPNSAAVRSALSRAYGRLGDHKAEAEQAAIAKELMELDASASALTAERDRKPTDPAVRIQLSRFYRLHKQLKPAQAEAQAAAALEPASTVARAELNAVYRELGVDPPKE